MQWLEEYYVELEKIQKIERREIETKMLNDLKRQHLAEKQQQIAMLKEKLDVLLKDIESYQGLK